jgi:hypothetical protein
MPLIAYPYWLDVRAFPSWWVGVSCSLPIFAALAGAALLVTAAIALPRQIGGTDPAARGGWWLDYAEHATVLGLAGVLAASRGPGWRILRGLCSAVWQVVQRGMAVAGTGRRAGSPGSPRIVGSHRRRGCTSSGIGFGVAAGRGSEREVTGAPRLDLPWRAKPSPICSGGSIRHLAWLWDLRSMWAPHLRPDFSLLASLGQRAEQRQKELWARDGYVF